jgi:two-component system, chemotaxis family, chemotaxis protein CheY
MALRVMIVDDNPDITHLLAMMLPRIVANCEIVAARDGAEGLDLLEDAAPDVVLTNLRMPFMDGLTLIGEIRRNVAWDHIRLWMMSAESTPDVRERAATEGAEAFLAKPFTVADLRKLLTEQGF